MNLSKNKTPTRTYKSEIKLNKENGVSILNHAIAHKRAFNWGFALKQREWKENKRNLSLFDLQGIFNQIKETDPEIKSWNDGISSKVSKKAFEDLDKAYDNFFRRWSEGKRGKQAGFPKYKTIQSKRSFHLEGNFNIEENQITLPIIGVVKLRRKNYLPIARTTGDKETSSGPRIKSATISEFTPGRWQISVSYAMKQEVNEECKYKDPSKVIGIDLGIKTLIVGSDGLHIDNPKFLKKSERRLKHLQRLLSKKKKGSKNREKAKKKVTDLHLKIKNQRLDYLEKISTFTTKEYSVVGMETLNIEEMKSDPTKAKAISDCSWGYLTKRIKDKQIKHNCRVIELNQWFPSSQLCNKCGHQKKDLTLKDRTYKCNNCSHKEGRDLNAAMNIRDLTILKLNSEVTLGLKGTIKVCGDLDPCSDQNKDQDKFESMKQKVFCKWI